MTADDVPAFLDRGVLYISKDGQPWTEIGWAEGAPAFTMPAPAILAPMLTARGPLSATFTIPLDRSHGRLLKRWMRAASNPRPLCIDGHEYHRRSKARRRRGR